LSSRFAAVAFALLAGFALAGCYASTEPATDIGPTKATLNAQGTANNGGARSWFELEITGRVGDPPQIGNHYNWPAGASGPFSHTVGGLSAGSEYSFRVCGADDGVPDEDAPCAQTRTFNTPAATQDSVHGGWWGGCCASESVQATSGPSGENPNGTMHWQIGPYTTPVSYSYTGIVTCLLVTGRTAIVGSVGQRKASTGETTPSTMLVRVIDGETAADTYQGMEPQPGSTPPSCEGASFPTDPYPEATWFEMVVNDAQP
jgi:hypothetical protein